jgi:Holliday junction DNA helicase RuvA
VGKKTAERLIVEMRDKLPKLEGLSQNTENNATEVSVGRSNAKQEAISALCALGYKAAEASKMVQNIAQEDKSCEEIIRLALKGK